MPSAKAFLSAFSLALLALGGPVHFERDAQPKTMSLEARASFTKQNGLDAQKLNAKFKTLKASSSCKSGEVACINGNFAQCSNNKFVIFPCSGGLACVALPLVNSPGTRSVPPFVVVLLF